jgi:hypothetical protein
MNGSKFLLDTNAIFYILNGDETLTDFLFEKELYASVITEMELLSYKNITPAEQLTIENFLNDLVIINIDDRIKAYAIEVKKTSNMKLPDSIIAGTAIALKLPLVTSDKQFKTIKDLELVYYEK